jgi:hypothetical protein
MPGHRLELEGPGDGRFVPLQDGPVIEVTERVDRRFLGHTEIAQFRIVSAAADTGNARLSIRHTGKLRRQGVGVEVSIGDESTRLLAKSIGDDHAFTSAAMNLDFTRFELARVDRQWSSTVELMGASYVSLALPPMRSYVRLHADQRQALVETLTALDAHLKGADTRST